MDESGRSSGDGSMLAVLKSTPEIAAELAAKPASGSPTTTPRGRPCLPGPRDGLRRAAEIGRERGVRSLALDVTGAFHSPCMAAAQQPFREALAHAEFSEPAVTVFSGLTAAPFVDMRDELARALTAPVRWRETMVALAAHGAEPVCRRRPRPGPGAAGSAQRRGRATAISLEDQRVGNA